MRTTLLLITATPSLRGTLHYTWFLHFVHHSSARSLRPRNAVGQRPLGMRAASPAVCVQDESGKRSAPEILLSHENAFAAGGATISLEYFLADSRHCQLGQLCLPSHSIGSKLP
uniref:Putative secreted protein n=1 Tax=Ixodes ricinus TaxID=34613 RepID=A0A6B0UKB2_IXORI